MANLSDKVTPSGVATTAQLDAKAPLAAPTFTGVPSAPTATAGTDTTQIASTAFVLANGSSTVMLDATVSNVAFVSFTITQDFHSVLLNMVGLVPEVSSGHLHVEFSTDGGTNWLTGSNDYTWGYSMGPADNFGGDTSDDHIQLTQVTIPVYEDTSSDYGFNTNAVIGNPRSNLPTTISSNCSYESANNYSRNGVSTGTLKQSAVVNAVKIYFHNGNIRSGHISARGLK